MQLEGHMSTFKGGSLASSLYAARVPLVLLHAMKNLSMVFSDTFVRATL
jgi:hypothetical protein